MYSSPGESDDDSLTSIEALVSQRMSLLALVSPLAFPNPIVSLVALMSPHYSLLNEFSMLGESSSPGESSGESYQHRGLLHFHELFCVVRCPKIAFRFNLNWSPAVRPKFLFETVCDLLLTTSSCYF